MAQPKCCSCAAPDLSPPFGRDPIVELRAHGDQTLAGDVVRPTALAGDKSASAHFLEQYQVAVFQPPPFPRQAFRIDQVAAIIAFKHDLTAPSQGVERSLLRF